MIAPHIYKKSLLKDLEKDENEDICSGVGGSHPEQTTFHYDE